jgi:hypothetical protein
MLYESGIVTATTALRVGYYYAYIVLIRGCLQAVTALRAVDSPGP